MCRVPAPAQEATVRTIIGLAVIVLASSAASAFGQAERAPRRPRLQQANPSRKAAESPKTDITIEISAGGSGVGLPTLNWKPVFDELGIPVTIQPGNLNGQPETTETNTAGRRHVLVKGGMDRQGTLLFEGHRFTSDEAGKFKAWIAELKAYGAQGSPEGKPAWGLNPEQFNDLFAALTAQLVDSVTGLSLEEAVKKLAIDPKYPVHSSREAQEHLGKAPASQVRNTLDGFSKGTALAVILSEQGLGFRPVRSQTGAITIEIVPSSDEPNAIWPIGWDPKLNRPQTVPQMFKLVSIDLKDAPFMDVITGIAVKAELQFLFDYHRIAARQIDLEKLRVSFPARQAAYNTLLRTVTLSNRMNHRIQVDEGAHPFVWISTIEVRSPER